MARSAPLCCHFRCRCARDANVLEKYQGDVGKESIAYEYEKHSRQAPLAAVPDDPDFVGNSEEIIVVQ